jgi:peptidoglycan-associated lipoprotein
MIKRWIATLALATLGAALMTACTSTNLNDVPVEDKSGKAVGEVVSTTPKGTATMAGERDVKPVTLDTAGADKAGPAGVARVVYFDYDSYVIKPEFQALIESHAKFLKSTTTRKIMLEGHTDERGGREYNLALGQKRSEAVRRALGLLGVADGQVEAVSFGKEKPTATGSDEASFAKNRRAEIAYR